MKTKSLLSMEKNIIDWEKMPYYNCKKLLFVKYNDLESSFEAINLLQKESRKL